ncbi:MAG: DUF5696 domain-containing protein [Victivallales bacterium]
MKNAQQQTLQDTVTIANEVSSLQLSPNGQLRFALKGGSAWESPGAVILMHYYDRQHPRPAVVSAPSQNANAFGTAGTPSLASRGDIVVQRHTADELLVHANFPRIDIRIDIHFLLRPDGQGFSVRIDDADIVEGNPMLYRILSIEMLPEFGAAITGESGYLTLPNWAGCQTFFNKDYPREVRQTIYSSNDQWEHVCNMPVFGITRAQGTLCGLVAAGDFDAQLISRVHWERAHTNSTHPALVYRWEQQDTRIPGRREVRYSFAPAEYDGGEGYVFIGKAYRQFLHAERGLQTWAEKAVTRPEALEYRDRFFLKIFMAYKDPAEDGHGPYHPVCTFAEARKILEACQARGMAKITAILVGWGQDGHDGMPPTRFPVDERLGGETEFRNLIAWCKAHDVQLGVHDSYGGAYSCSPEFDVKDLICHRSGEYWACIIWSGGRSHIICPAVFLDKHVKRDVPAIAALGLHGHHHVDAVGSFMPCFSPEHPVEQRSAYVDYVRQMFTYINASIGSVSTEMPFGPYFDVVDGFYHSYVNPSPWHLASPVGRYLYDRTVPLLMVALNGSLKCCEGVRVDAGYRAMLADLGVSPQGEVSWLPSKPFGISSYETLADLLADTYKNCYGESSQLARLRCLEIEGRWEIIPGVNRTRYSDGTEVTVNRTDKPCEGLAPYAVSIHPKPASKAGRK